MIAPLPAVLHAVVGPFHPNDCISFYSSGQDLRGTPTKLDRVENAFIGKYQARQTLSCSICGVMYQFASKTDLLRAATVSGGDLVEYFIEDDDEVDDRRLN